MAIRKINIYWLLFQICCLTFHLYPQQQDIKFDHLTMEDGLSNNIVIDIAQDKKGFIWIGTQDGLNRYDGHKLTIYRNDPNDSLSLSNNSILALYTDHAGILWVGTQYNGLCRYDSNRDVFIHYPHIKKDASSLISNWVLKIYETSQKVLWVGSDSGLNRYNREGDNFTRYYPDENKEGIETNVNWVQAITEDDTGRLWIGSYNEGLFYLDSEKDKFIKYKVPLAYSKIFPNQYITNIHASRWHGKSLLWVENSNYGLYKIDLASNKVTHYKHQPDNPTSISDNNISAIYQIENNNKELWVATVYGGLNRLDIRTDAFTRYRNQPENPHSLSRDWVASILADNQGLIWVGTSKGINRFDPTASGFRSLRNYGEGQIDLSGSHVTVIHESNPGEGQAVLWIGASTGGLKRIERGNGNYQEFTHDPENEHSLSDNWITGIIETHLADKKVLWVSTLGGLGGLNRIDLQTNRITRYFIPHDDPAHHGLFALCEDRNGVVWVSSFSNYIYRFDPNTEQFSQSELFDNAIFTLKADDSGILWLGGAGGFYKFNPLTKEKTHYPYISGDSSSVNNNVVLSIYEDRTGTYWIGSTGGLTKFDRSEEAFTYFTEKDGLSSQFIKATLEDEQGNLWLSTDKGISKFDLLRKTFKNYFQADGLHGNEFVRDASFINQHGEMFFGGVDGLTYFHPDSIKEDDYIPPLVFTDFQVFNKSVQPGDNSPLKNHISEAQDITLTHDQSIFSIEFAALEYQQAERIQYAYQMENVDPDWVFTDASRRFVTYTQLDPGEYIFRVKSSNKDKLWDEVGRSITITILPPWWQTWWAYLIYAALFFTILFVLRRYELNRQGLKHQMEMEHLTSEKLKEVDRMKSRFFANISHEFRTPLTLIEGPMEQLLSGEFKGSVTDQYQRILRNTRRLLRLVNQLLDISRLEAGKMKLAAGPENIVALTRQLTMAFESLASVRDIEIDFIAPDQLDTIFIDREKYEKIIINLISNAIKFTEDGGNITVQLSVNSDHAASTKLTTDNCLLITVKDSGSGIPPEHLPHIFDRFYQANETHVQDAQGSGIGLALTKELVELHHGTISVESEAGIGTTFTISLPLGKAHLAPEQISDVEDAGVRAKHPLEDIETHVEEFARDASSLRHRSLNPPLPEEADTQSPIVLLVEDNPDMRAYIREILADTYDVAEAANGRAGFEKAAEVIPDIIISDVMMPEMDGIQFCEQIKTDERTSHIPVILLTAKSSGESKMEGLETGADDYLVKPFDKSELLVRVKNLIKQRRELRERFRQEISLAPENIALTSADAKFLQRVIDAVEENIEAADFGVRELATVVGMSRSQLHRKLKALTDHPPLEFIRTIKLKRAAALLKHHTGNISEIAYQVGFSNPSYFAECFRKLYGVPPREYSSKVDE